MRLNDKLLFYILNILHWLKNIIYGLKNFKFISYSLMLFNINEYDIINVISINLLLKI